MEVNFWNKELETLDREALKKLQLKRLKETVNQALKTTFYKKRLKEVNINSADDIKSLEDLKKIPFTT